MSHTHSAYSRRAVALWAFSWMTVTGCATELAEESDEIGVVEQGLTTQSFTTTYSGINGNSIGTTCNASKNIKGFEPADSGTYPVFVFVTGTSMPYDAGVADNLVQYMAAQGFVAASVAYDNSQYPTSCGPLQKKAKCIYDNRTTSSNSAVSVICRRAKAACATKGIYISGFSQGAQISSMAANYGDNMRAAYLIGNGDDSAAAFDNLRGCLDKSNLAFTSSQLREVSGERDQFFGGAFRPSQAGAQTQLERLTGVDCARGTYSCLQADGSGWYIVSNAQLTDSYADHCYFYNGSPNSNTNCLTSTPAYDSNWNTGPDPWQKIPSLAWLKSK